MIRMARHAFRRFCADDTGSSNLVEFALWAPLFIGLILSGIELAAVTARHTALERALDQTVRDVRLGTGQKYDHASLKASICERAAILPACSENLKLEMVKLKPRDWTAPPKQVRCVNTTEVAQPVVAFEYGRDNELMMLRACYRYKTVAPTSGLAANLAKDEEGYAAIVSTSAFVQEPG